MHGMLCIFQIFHQNLVRIGINVLFVKVTDTLLLVPQSSVLLIENFGTMITTILLRISTLIRCF